MAKQAGKSLLNTLSGVQNSTKTSQTAHFASASVHNSGGSAKVSKELAQDFGQAFGELWENGLDDALQTRLRTVEDEAIRRKFKNQRFLDTDRKQWTCSDDDAEIIHAASVCSGAAYDDGVPSGLGLTHVGTKSGSPLRTIKAVSVWKLAESTLLVAMKGSTALRDHGILNGRVPSAAAHGGFLRAAQYLTSDIQTLLFNQIKSNLVIKDIVLTGHPSGGAVAQLLFAHFVAETQQTDRLAPCKLSLITLASPPTITPVTITETLKDYGRVKRVLAFVNEFDPIPRADRDYIRSMGDMYALNYGLLPPRKEDLIETLDSGRSVWKLPAQRLFLIGDIVMLEDNSQFLVGTEESSQFLFFDALQNDCEVYIERMEALKMKALKFGTNMH